MKSLDLLPTEIPEKLKIPERNLWARVLELAIRDALKGNSKARNWTLNRSKQVYSFCWVCNTLDMKPEVIREIIIKNKIEFLKNI